MPFRFFRRVPLGKGLTMNISKTGLSFSAGPRGGAFTLGTSGARGTMSLPGTGLFYTVDKKNILTGKKKRSPQKPKRANALPPDSPLELGFFDKWRVPKEEQVVVEGFKALVGGDHALALEYFELAPNTADARWIAGMIRLKQGEHDLAEAHLKFALSHEKALGALVAKYDVEVVLRLPITEHIFALAQPRRRGTLLAMVECQQDRGDYHSALHYCHQLVEEHPEDLLVTLSMVELQSMMASPLSESTAKEWVAMIGALDNDSDVHAALLMYKAQALMVLGLNKAGLTTLTQAYRKKKDRDEALLRAIRYQRIKAYQRLGQKSRALVELEGLYAEAPDYEDVAEQLGLA